VAVTRLNSFSDVQNFIASILKGNNVDASQAPHGEFWLTLSYAQFVNGNVPGVADPSTQKPMPILVVGKSAQSNLILALRGAPGTAFDPNTGAIGQMPFNGPPFTNDQIQSLADWIDRNCPK
jgi:hypothetical protein